MISYDFMKIVFRSIHNYLLQTKDTPFICFFEILRFTNTNSNDVWSPFQEVRWTWYLIGQQISWYDIWLVSTSADVNILLPPPRPLLKYCPCPIPASFLFIKLNREVTFTLKDTNFFPSQFWAQEKCPSAFPFVWVYIFNSISY